MGIPLWSSRGIMKDMAMDGAFALFNGFLTFLMYKLGYKPKVHESFEIDLDDNSWWINNLDAPSFMGLSFNSYFTDQEIPPFIFKQFVNKIGKDITIGIILDWFSFYECGLALMKSKLDEESKYSDKITSEFHLRSDKTFHEFLEYFRDLRDKDFAQSHKLVLRSDKLVDYVTKLDDTYTNFEDFPENISTVEEWNKMSTMERYGSSEIGCCTEDNFKELLRKASIEIPNVEFQSFNEFISDKLISSTNEWEDIRDRYISKLKKSIKEPDISKDFKRAKRFIQSAKNSLDHRNFNDTILSSSKAMEDALSTFLECSHVKLEYMINKIALNKELGNHVNNLHYIRKIRNDTVHVSDFVVTEDIARHVFDMCDEFLADVQKTIR